MRFLIIESGNPIVIDFNNSVEAIEYIREQTKKKAQSLSVFGIKTVYREEADPTFQTVLTKDTGSVVFAMNLYRISNVKFTENN